MPDWHQARRKIDFFATDRLDSSRTISPLRQALRRQRQGLSLSVLGSVLGHDLRAAESLADIEVCLRVRCDQRYRMGFRAPVAHSTLADANRVRDWRIYADLAAGDVWSLMLGDSLAVGAWCLEALIRFSPACFEGFAG